MKISDVSIIPIRQKFKYPLKTSGSNFDYSEGLVITIKSNKVVGYGESSPLRGFNVESLKEISYALESYRLATFDIGKTSIDELLSLIPIHSNGYPSVEFGLETAIYDLVSQIDGKSFSKYLNPQRCTPRVK